MRPDRVLFVHGWWAGAWVWSRVEPVFRARGFETRAIDLPLPAPGRSAGGTRFVDHLAAVREAADAMGGPALVGHSLGGLLALRLASERALPACVALTPAAPRGVFSLVSGDLVRLALRHSPAMLLSRPFRPSDAALRRIDLNRLLPGEQDDVLSRMGPAPGRQGLEVGVLGVSVRPGRTATPLLVVGASEDRLTPRSVVRRTAAVLGAEHREYPGHAHYLIREPGCGAIANDVAEWITRMAGHWTVRGARAG